MCGIAGMFGRLATRAEVSAMVNSQRHRGPDASAVCSVAPAVVLGHSRLSILDLSDAGRQPMTSASGRSVVVLNGEIYNYLELRRELSGYPFRTGTDTEVVLAAYERWGDACLDRFLGMFALIIWDAEQQRVLAARDRFGVKPLHWHESTDGTLMLASEIKALHAAGVPAEPDPVAWSSHLANGAFETGTRTFWRQVSSLPAGHALSWQNNAWRIWRWYDLAARVGVEYDTRPERVVLDEYRALLEESVRLRFRADVPVGINISGGLDSSVLLGVVRNVQPSDSEVSAFTFVTGDANYDELPWVQQALARTRHPLVVCSARLRRRATTGRGHPPGSGWPVRRHSHTGLRTNLRGGAATRRDRAARRTRDGRAMGGLRLLSFRRVGRPRHCPRQRRRARAPGDVASGVSRAGGVQ